MLAADYTGHTPTTTENASAAWPDGPIADHVLLGGMPAQGTSCPAARVLGLLAEALDDTTHELALARNELFNLQGGER